MLFRFASRLMVLAMVGVAPAVVAQEAPDIQTPDRGEVLRADILDALRDGVRDVRGLRRDVLFRVHKLAVLDDYALVTVTPIAKDGDTIPDYEADRMCDREILALLVRGNKVWQVAERDVGPCDYIWPTVFAQNPDYPDALLRFWEQMDATY